MFVFTLVFAGPMLAVAVPTSVSALSESECEKRFLGIPPWYRGLVKVEADPMNGGETCAVKGPSDAGVGGIGGFITKLAFNVIEIGVVIAAYIASFFILYGGFRFLTGGGNASSIEAARKTILNAVIGLAIALGAVAILNLIFGIFLT